MLLLDSVEVTTDGDDTGGCWCDEVDGVGVNGLKLEENELFAFVPGATDPEELV